MQLANLLVSSRQARNVLLVTSDTYTKYVNPKDRTVRMLFGDAATATLIGRSDQDDAIGPFIVGTDGDGAEALIVPAGGFRKPHSAETAREAADATGCVRSLDNLYMDGQAVFAFAISRVPDLVAGLLDLAHTPMSEIDWIVYHQANQYMLENLALCSRIPPEKVIYHLRDVGNTVSSSIPLAIQQYVESGRVQCGQRLMLIGFGVGYSWAGCLMRWAAAADEGVKGEE
jgi:3-oxoacyl-[acyl-carrier-protein] synthase-3